MKEFKYRAYDPTGLLKTGISTAANKTELTRQLKKFGFSDIIVIDTDMELPVKRFRYLAKDAGGEIIDGVTEAANEQELVGQLEQLGLSDISAEEIPPEEDEYDERLRQESIRVRRRRQGIENALILILGVLGLAIVSSLAYKWVTRPQMPLPDFYPRSNLRGLEFTEIDFDGKDLTFTVECEATHDDVTLMFEGYDGLNQMVDEGTMRIGHLGAFYERTKKTVSFELNQESYFDHIDIYAYPTKER